MTSGNGTPIKQHDVDYVGDGLRKSETMRPRRPLAIAGALAGAVAIVVLTVLVGSSLTDLQRGVAASPSPSGASAASASATPIASPRPSASPTPLPSGRPTGGIEAYSLGALQGEYAFVLNGGATTTAGAVAEVWAIPLAGGEPRLAARYVNTKTPSTATGANVLARQFSPDGRRLLLSAATARAAGGERLALFIVNLETGRVQPLGSEDGADHERPAWSPDGKHIAYVR
jgi:hypothetical protein